MKKITIIITILALFLVTAAPLLAQQDDGADGVAAAEDGVEAYKELGEETDFSSIVIPQKRQLSSSVFGVFSEIRIEGLLKGNLIAYSASDVKVSGVVDGLSISAGQSLYLTGTFRDNVIMGGLNVHGSGAQFEDDVILAANAVLFDDETTVMGNVFIYAAGDVNLSGRIDGKVFVKAKSVTINAAIGGDVTLISSNIQLGASAALEGDLIHSSTLSPLIDENAVVSGEIVSKNRLWITSTKGASNSLYTTIGMLLSKILALFLIASAFGLLSPGFFVDCIQITRQKMFTTFLLGIGILLAGIILSVFMIIGTITIVPGLIVMGLVLLLWLLAPIPAALWVARVLFGGLKNGAIQMLMGLICVTAITYIPYIGSVATIIITCVGAGSIFTRFLAGIRLRRYEIRNMPVENEGDGTDGDGGADDD